MTSGRSATIDSGTIDKAPSTRAIVHAVTIEHHREPLGIGERAPRISWKVQTRRPDWVQQAYEIRVVDPDRDDEFHSGRIDSPESVLVAWPTHPLASRTARTLAVRVWGRGDEEPSDWSKPLGVETGLLDDSDWQAELITPDWDEDTSVDQPAVLFRSDFTSVGEIAAARLYLTAHGVVEAVVNGAVVGADVLSPGWTSYLHRLRYYTYDVTDLVRDGENAIGATVADGWFRGLIGFEGGRRNIYGERLGLFAQLEIRYHDGTVRTIGTDSAWRCAQGAILRSGIYAGETYDARRELDGWSRPGFDVASWSGVRTSGAPPETLVAPTGPPVRRIEEIAPVDVFSSPSGQTLIDFGQNMVGRLRIRVTGSAGDVVTLRHAEVLEHGELGARPLRLAEATDTYTLRGGGIEEWEPRFTFHGFRYAEVDGWPGTLAPGDITAVVLHTDMERTGWFSCSDEMINRLHDNVVWGMRGNFLDVPTDCPQRDERLGWTGDLQVFAPTARFLYDCSGMLSSWLADLTAEQGQFGTVPIYVPYVQLLFPPAPVAAWGDAAVMVPWVLYQRTGDLEFLRRQYDSMRTWVDQVASIAGEDHLWNTGLQLGDWLDPAAPPDQPNAARTDRNLVATAYHALTAQVLSEAAAALGNRADEQRYGELAERVRVAFRREYVSPNGRLVSDAPTALALALRFDLLEPGQRTTAGNRLVSLVKSGDHRIATGFVGTPIICDALCDVGAFDTAYHLLTQRECPSWLYPVTMGATTIWERWDSMLPDGTINPGDMTSFNHYALGAVADWMHRTVAGLAPAETGYRTLFIAPRPGGGLTWAGAAHETPFGRAEVRWTRDGETLRVTVVVPPGSTALVRLPQDGWQDEEVGSGEHSFNCRFRAAADDPPIPRLNRYGEPVEEGATR